MSRKPAQIQAEIQQLVEVPAFRRFLFRIVEASGIGFSATKDDKALLNEGKRALGLEILGWVEDALPDATTSSQPFAALHLAIAEELTPKETRNDDRSNESHRPD